MHKKLLSLFVVLCMVLGMVPAVLAASLEDFTDAEVAMYVDKDTTLKEAVEGLVVVTAPVKVIVDGAKLTAGIAILEEAAGAEVDITGEADVNAVVVLADATVVIEEKASIKAVSVAAPAADVEVAGKVDTISVESDAAGAKVAVKETATVTTVSVSAPKAEVAVAGKVQAVQVKEAAAAAKVTVEKTATVTTVEVAAPDTAIDVAGTVENVEVAESATGAELVVEEGAAIEEVTDATGGLEVSGEGAGNVTVTDTAAPAEEKKENKPAASNSESSSVTDPAPAQTTRRSPKSFVKSGVTLPQIDQANIGPWRYDEEGNGTPGDVNKWGDGHLTVTGSNLHFDATDIPTHFNQSQTAARWVGVAIPKAEGYTCYVIKRNNDGTYHADVMYDDGEQYIKYWDADKAVEGQYYVGILTSETADAKGITIPEGGKDFSADQLEEIFDALLAVTAETNPSIDKDNPNDWVPVEDEDDEDASADAGIESNSVDGEAVTLGDDTDENSADVTEGTEETASEEPVEEPEEEPEENEEPASEEPVEEPEETQEPEIGE